MPNYLADMLTQGDDAGGRNYLQDYETPYVPTYAVSSANYLKDLVDRADSSMYSQNALDNPLFFLGTSNLPSSGMIRGMADKLGKGNITTGTTPQPEGGAFAKNVSVGDDVIRIDFLDENGRNSWVALNRPDLSLQRYGISNKYYVAPEHAEKSLSQYDDSWSREVHPDERIPEYIETAKQSALNFLEHPSVKKYMGLPQDIFIRFGKPPKSGKSKNYQTGEELEGVSAIEGRVVFNNGKPAIEPVGLEDPSTVVSYAGMRMKPALYTGEVIGYGPDGEPLLRSHKKIGDLKIDGDGNFALPNLSRSPLGGEQPSNSLLIGGE